jgi:UDP-N-acetylglucosamine acyltransferase
VSIHSTAVISPDAELGQDVCIGPYSIVEPGVVIGDGCTLESYVAVKRGTTLGPGNHVFDGAILGGLPQHLHMGAECGRLVIGANNTIRENATIHRGLGPADLTTLGDRNMIMVGVHVAHDCHIGNDVVIINNAMLAGHVTVEDRVYMAGGAGVQQFRRVGRLATVGGYGRAVKDVPPYVTLDGFANGIVGLNLVGIRRAGYSRDDVKQLKAAYRLIYRIGLTWNEVLQRLPVEFPDGPAADFYRFFSTGQHGFMPERRIPEAATIKIFPESEPATPAAKVG